MATALQVIQAAQAELGLPRASSLSSTDPMVHQFRALLNASGLMLVKAFDWQALQREYLFSTAVGQSVYSLPAGYDRFTAGTDWDRTQTERMVQSSPRVWAAIKNDGLGSTVNYRWRLRGNQIHLDPVPAAIHTVSIEYITSYWLQAADGLTGLVEVQNDSDDVLLSYPLTVALVKLKWLEAKGFGTDAEQRNYMRWVADAKATDTPAEILSMDGVMADGLVGPDNLAETGWGT